MRKTLLVLASVALAMVVASGVAWAANIQCPNRDVCFGTNSADTMYGNNDLNYMKGKAGADTMYGYDESDNMFGGKNSDTLYGGQGGDGVAGDLGSDKLYGGPDGDAMFANPSPSSQQRDSSNDYLHGGGGPDHIWGVWASGGVDRLYGEGGDDLIGTSQRQHGDTPVTKEIIDCGLGEDHVSFDRGVDRVKHCEIKNPF